MIIIIITTGLIATSLTAVFLLLKLQRYSLAARYLKDQLQSAQDEIAELRFKLEATTKAKFDTEKALDVMAQKLTEAQNHLLNWEKNKEDIVAYTKAAAFEVGTQLSSKLLEEHKLLTQEAKQEASTKVTETTTGINEQFQKVMNIIASFDGQLKESKSTVELVRRALLSPSGAGALAEITLENILKASGLSQGYDFVMQYSIGDNNDGRLRPDAVVFLPAGNVMVIDSKASKFFLELAEASQTEDTTLVNKLKSSMRSLLKDLSARDYKEAIRQHLGKIRPGEQVNHISAIMFLPSETAVERLCNSDKEFMSKAWELDIMPAGPVGLVNILSQVKFFLSEEKQSQNHKVIAEEVRKLLASISTLYEYMKKSGSAIQTAAGNYDKMAASFNSNILPKTKKLQQLGINLQQNKALSLPLDRYQLVPSPSHIIESESSDQETVNCELLVE